jgi:hypothetical protein
MGGEIVEWRRCPALMDFETAENVINLINSLPPKKIQEVKSLLK